MMKIHLHSAFFLNLEIVKTARELLYGVNLDFARGFWVKASGGFSSWVHRSGRPSGVQNRFIRQVDCGEGLKSCNSWGDSSL